MPHDLIEKQVIFEGKRVHLEVHQLRDQETGKKSFREVIVHPGAVVILPFASRTEIILIKQRRHAIGKAILELPAGTLEANEIPMNCAGRELLEETGFLAGRMRMLGNFYSSPGILSEKMYAFAAHDLEKHEQKLDEGEEIDELITVSLEESIEMIRTGELNDAKSIATLLMYDRFYRDDLPSAVRAD